MARGICRAQSNIYDAYFAKIVNSFDPKKKLFTDIWQGLKYGSGASFVYEIMLAIDYFSSNRIVCSNWNNLLLALRKKKKWKKIMRINNWNIVTAKISMHITKFFVKWYFLCHSLNKTVVANCLLLLIFHSIMYILNKIEKTWLTELFWSKIKS